MSLWRKPEVSSNTYDDLLHRLRAGGAEPTRSLTLRKNFDCEAVEDSSGLRQRLIRDPLAYARGSLGVIQAWP